MNKWAILAKKRRLAGISQVELGKRLGIHQSHVCKLELGEFGEVGREKWFDDADQILSKLLLKKDKSYQQMRNNLENKNAAN